MPKYRYVSGKKNTMNRAEPSFAHPVLYLTTNFISRYARSEEKDSSKLRNLSRSAYNIISISGIIFFYFFYKINFDQCLSFGWLVDT
jgi:hypothetical protein